MKKAKPLKNGDAKLQGLTWCFTIMPASYRLYSYYSVINLYAGMQVFLWKGVIQDDLTLNQIINNRERKHEKGKTIEKW